eukprot:173890-Heterocapsa_arctica.AAC.1
MCTFTTKNQCDNTWGFEHNIAWHIYTWTAGHDVSIFSEGGAVASCLVPLRAAADAQAGAPFHVQHGGGVAVAYVFQPIVLALLQLLQAYVLAFRRRRTLTFTRSTHCTNSPARSASSSECI